MKKIMIGTTAVLAAFAMSGGLASAQDEYVPPGEINVGATLVECITVDDGVPAFAVTVTSSFDTAIVESFAIRLSDANGTIFGPQTYSPTVNGENAGLTVSVPFPGFTGGWTSVGTPTDFYQLDSSAFTVQATVNLTVAGGPFATPERAVTIVSGVDCLSQRVPGTVSIDGLTTVCVADAPFIAYNIELDGIDWPGQATLTFFTNRTPSEQVGIPVVVTQQSGRVIYPGATVDAQGRGIDWPGWRQAPNGDWEPDPTDAFLRDGLQIQVEVNPTATATVFYPPATEVCADPPRRQSTPPTTTPLPRTGLSTLDTSMRMGAIVLIGGLGFVIIARRRRNVAV